MIVNDIYDNLRAVPRNRKIAILGLNKKAFDILTITVNVRINVWCFIDDLGLYNKLSIFNKSVFTKEEIQNNCEGLFILVDHSGYEKNRIWLQKYFNQKFYVVEIGTIEKEIRDSERVFIYGAGRAGRKTLEILKDQNIKVRGFIDSNPNRQGGFWSDYPIFGKEILCRTDAVIISTLNYNNEIYNDLSQNHDMLKLFVDYRNSRVGDKPITYTDKSSISLKYKNYPIEYMEEIRELYSILWSDFKGKELIFYGWNDIAKQAIEIFELLGFKIAYIVDDEMVGEYENYLIKDVYELAYEKIGDKLIIITKVDEKKSKQGGKICIDSGGRLEELGVSYFRNYRSLLQTRVAFREMLSDFLVVCVARYSKTIRRELGLNRCGSDKNIRIAVLGGSTSTLQLYENVVKSWPEYLADIFEGATIVSAAEVGFESTRELLKLIRDIGQLKPHLVISYSGVNDAGIPKKERNAFVQQGIVDVLGKNRWYGIENLSTSSEHWLMMERYMKAICDVNGSEFISILQPAFALRRKEDMSREEKRLTMLWDKENKMMAEYCDFSDDIKNQIHNYEWMYDLTTVFDGIKETVYRDNCHLTSYGNEVIAKNIYQIIVRHYEEKGKKL